jgi:hypothetical protein
MSSDANALPFRLVRLSLSALRSMCCTVPPTCSHLSNLVSDLGVLTQGAFSFSCIFAGVALEAPARRHQRTISKSSGPFGPVIASLDASGPVVGVALPQGALALGLVLLA